MYGQESPQPIVTIRSACSASSVVRSFGRCSERSIPTSRIASTTWGCTRSAGVVPAESATCRPLAARSNSARLICERPALWRQTNSTVATTLERGRRLFGREEVRDALGFALVERYGCLHAGLSDLRLAPDAEAHVPLVGLLAEVARDPQRAPSVALDGRVSEEELGHLDPLRAAAPRTEAKRALDL